MSSAGGGIAPPTESAPSAAPPVEITALTALPAAPNAGTPTPASPSGSGRPGWGWDFCFVFRAPGFTDGQVRQGAYAVVAGVEGEDDEGGSDSSPHNFDVSEEEPATPLDAESCVVIDDDDKAIKEAVEMRCNILARLCSAGFAFSQIYVPSEESIFLRFGLSNKALQAKAEKMGMELGLRDEHGGGFIKFTKSAAASFKNSSRPSLEAGSPYFCPSDRILIILATLQSKEAWGCDLNIERLVFKGKIMQAFAVHSPPEQQQLVRDVVWGRKFTPPIDKMKEYLGARVTLYFCFLSFYAHYLVGIAALSIPVYVMYRVLRNYFALAVLRCVFGLALVLWTTLFLEQWKRRNADVNIQFGLNDYHEDTSDDTRPQFRGETRVGFYCRGGFVSLDDLVSSTGVDVENGGSGGLNRGVPLDELPKNPWHDPREARNAVIVSFAVTCLCVSVVATFIFLILFFRSDIVAYFSTRIPVLANAMPGILNAIVIAVSDPIWQAVSVALTRRENHRTNQRVRSLPPIAQRRGRRALPHSAPHSAD
jgi:Calcium-activated chloride channel